MTIPAAAVKAQALALDFVACGITDPSPTAHADALDSWLARGYAGTMRYLHRQARRRKDPQTIMPEARSVVVVLDNYYSPSNGDPAAAGAPRIAKYALGEDYHSVTTRRLDELAAFLRQNGAKLQESIGSIGERSVKVPSSIDP